MENEHGGKSNGPLWQADATSDRLPLPYAAPVRVRRGSDAAKCGKPRPDRSHRLLNCTPAQCLFRIAQANGVIPLAGSTSETHMKDGVDTEKLDINSVAGDEDYESLRSILFDRNTSVEFA